MALAGIDTGPFLLAWAGLLDGYRATCHWESLPGFRESFPKVTAEQSLYVFDRDRLTCAGGAIDHRHDAGLDQPAAGQEHCHSGCGPTPAFPFVPRRHQRGGFPRQAVMALKMARLLKVIAQMEERVEEPLAAEDLAEMAGLSLRQFERVFHTALGQRPMGFYLHLRLSGRKT